MEEAKTVLNSLALGWQSEIQELLHLEEKTQKPLTSYLDWCIFLQFTPQKKKNPTKVLHNTKTRSPMHLIYNFFSGFCKSPPKRKQKITLLILPM
jgi:hypothetical protein